MIGAGLVTTRPQPRRSNSRAQYLSSSDSLAGAGKGINTYFLSASSVLIIASSSTNSKKEPIHFIYYSKCASLLPSLPSWLWPTPPLLWKLDSRVRTAR